MTRQEVLAELEEYGDANTKNTLLKHGAKEPFFGVKVADLKKILKKTKKNHELSLELFDTGNSDAMYLAGLMADEKQITKKQLKN
jgi:3-methyladenine DNA glycosylase AlkD